ncbi:unnamed protein product [Rotaria magnacalcarata]|uniref:PIPK domain-containing protein n=2 Tax=Rotaria magnacalcarata TaxID=392030 RepID=A0A819IGQ7_9BILA|nr:unnamed protein product [Rotaria magnacalcarata]CAF3916077.1 unnamed protein product [Rotaria magnacalcarata]
MATSNNEISEGLLNIDLWDRLDFHLGSYVKSPIQLRYVSSKTSTIGRALQLSIVDLIDHVKRKFTDYTEDNATLLGTENRLYHSRQYSLNAKDVNIESFQSNGIDDKLNIEISSLAPTIFYQLREDIGISNEKFRQSFSEHDLKDFINTGRSGSLMYKTSDNLFILKTLRGYEARLLIQILQGYSNQFRQRPTMFNRYIGLYSIRLESSLSNFTIYVVVMVNAFTPSLKINEIFDLKGSSINRKITGYLSTEKFYKLKDMDFKDLYPTGIRIPTNIFRKLKTTLTNDAKALRKLNVTDFSLIVGIRHLDMSKTQMLDRQQMTGVRALLRATNSLTSIHQKDLAVDAPSSIVEYEVNSSLNSYLKPLEMLQEKLDMDLYYHNDSVAFETLPIPGIINNTNKRVYIYLALVDMLQTFDSFKLIDQAFRKITDPNRHLEYSVIEPNDYEQRFIQFLFTDVFYDANNDFPWAITDVSQSVADINNGEIKKKKRSNGKHQIDTPKSEIHGTNSEEILEVHF